MNDLSAQYLQPINARLTTPAKSLLLRMGLYYQALDPFAVSLVLDTKTTWRVLREYLEQALIRTEVGMFDVRVRNLGAHIQVWQNCNSGWASLDIDADVLAVFLHDTRDLIPSEFAPRDLSELEVL